MESVTIAETLQRLSLFIFRIIKETLIDAVHGIVQRAKAENEVFRFLQFQQVTAMKDGDKSLWPDPQNLFGSRIGFN
ncbi:MAG: hypothetical protein ACH255_16365 [Candidatus Thiodiazotropha sp.]